MISLPGYSNSKNAKNSDLDVIHSEVKKEYLAMLESLININREDEALNS